jgi:hypothetical protein
MKGNQKMSQFRLLSMCLVMSFIISACATVKPAPSAFEHDFSGATVPWTHTDFDDESGKFTFALFSDLTGGEREAVFELAVEQLNLLRPELIVSVGDLIEGGTMDHDQLDQEWNSFDERADRAHAPVFHVGGNHDLTNPDMWEVWEQRYGKRYYHFVYKNVLFLVLDTEDNPAEFQQYIHEIRLETIKVIDEYGWGEAAANTEYARLEEASSGRISAEQSAYFRQVIAEHGDVRWTFLLLHKAAWERPDEESFSTIEKALSDQPYTVFHGHLHAYKHQQRHGRDYIRLGTTGGSHQPDNPMAIDHVTLVTMTRDGPDIANLRMSGIFDKTGRIPLNGKELCLEMCSGK